MRLQGDLKVDFFPIRFLSLVWIPAVFVEATGHCHVWICSLDFVLLG